MLISIFFIWTVTTFGLWIVTLVVPGIRAKSTGALFMAALVLGLVNVFIRPVLWLLTLPLTVVTLGLFALVINALMFKLTASLVTGFEVKNFGSALLAALIMVMLGLLGLALLEWMMAGSVHWIYLERQSNGYFI